MSTLYERVNWTAGTAISQTPLNVMDAGIKALIPVGLIIPGWPDPDPPPGYLTCDGSEVLRATYPELWAVVDARGWVAAGLYGAGDGSTTFELPDIRDRFIKSPSAGQGGATGGVGTHTHANPATSTSGSHAHSQTTTSSVPDHSHSNTVTGPAGSHAHFLDGGATGAGGGHSHSFSDSFSTGGPSSSASGYEPGAFTHPSSIHTHSGSVSGSTSSTGSHTHSFGTLDTDTTADHSHSVNTSGGGGAHGHSNPNTDAAAGHSHTQGITTEVSNLPPYVELYSIVAT